MNTGGENGAKMTPNCHRKSSKKTMSFFCPGAASGGPRVSPGCPVCFPGAPGTRRTVGGCLLDRRGIPRRGVDCEEEAFMRDLHH